MTILPSSDDLEDYLWKLHDEGNTPLAVGTQSDQQPFLAYGWEPGGDGWDVGVITEGEFTVRAVDTGLLALRPADMLRYPLTVLASAQ